MAVSQAYDGYGVTLGKGDGTSSEDFDNFAEIVNVTLPNESVELIDVTHASSPNKYREFIAGLIDAGEVTFEVNMNQADYSILRADLVDNSVDNYQIVLPDDNFSTKPTIVFPAFVTGLEVSLAIEDKVTCSVTLKVSGAVVYTEGTT